MTLTVVTADDVGHTGTWCATEGDTLVQLPAGHVTGTGALALQAAWGAFCAAGGMNRAGVDATITYDRCRAATHVVRLSAEPGRVVGILAWDHFTPQGAAAVEAVALGMYGQRGRSVLAA